jgi:hypothetical protein
MTDEEYQDFYAICDHMPGAERVLRVGGKVMCPETGWSAHLVLTRPKGGAAEVMTLVDIDEWRQQPPAHEYEQVEFHRSDAKPPPIISVEHPQ